MPETPTEMKVRMIRESADAGQHHFNRSVKEPDFRQALSHIDEAKRHYTTVLELSRELGIKKASDVMLTALADCRKRRGVIFLQEAAKHHAAANAMDADNENRIPHYQKAVEHYKSALEHLPADEAVVNNIRNSIQGCSTALAVLNSVKRVQWRMAESERAIGMACESKAAADAIAHLNNALAHLEAVKTEAVGESSKRVITKFADERIAQVREALQTLRQPVREEPPSRVTRSSVDIAPRNPAPNNTARSGQGDSKQAERKKALEETKSFVHERFARQHGTTSWSRGGDLDRSEPSYHTNERDEHMDAVGKLRRMSGREGEPWEHVGGSDAEHRELKRMEGELRAAQPKRSAGTYEGGGNVYPNYAQDDPTEGMKRGPRESEKDFTARKIKTLKKNLEDYDNEPSDDRQWG